MGKIGELEGKKFNFLTVLYYYGNKKWLCRCDCGNLVKVVSTELKKGTTKSCGCWKKKYNKQCRTKHGQFQSKLHTVWGNMKRRCYNENCKMYSTYGGRGISVCDEWKNDFKNFYDWSMANGYDENAERGQCTLDRIDVNGNYEPSNCRWVENKVQQNNRRDNRIIEYKGEKYTLTQICEKFSLDSRNISWRLRNGWTDKEAIEIPNGTSRKEWRMKNACRL